jgi:hypothetical protein
MSRYKLRDGGYPFRKIMDGKNCIGRVDENSDGSFTLKKDYYRDKVQVPRRTT